MSPTPDGALVNLQQTIADLQRQLAASNAERDEAKAQRDESEAQRAALAEVLGVINSSPGDLAPVFDAVLEKAMHLCDAAFGYMTSGGKGRTVATRGVPPAYAEFRRHNPVPPGQGGIAARMRAGAPFVHVVDLKDDERYRSGSDPHRRAMVDLGGARTMLHVPLRRGDKRLGGIAIYRQEVRPFSDKQIVLLQNFAAQAVIAMENARLLTETREALEQQTATAEVLQVINSSPGDLAPVFEAILEKAHTLCGAAHGSLTLAEGQHFRAMATRGMPDEFATVLRQPFHPGRLIEELSGDAPFVQVADITAGGRAEDNPVHRAAADAGGVRTLLAVPLRKDGVLLGYITANRREVRPFADRQIALLENFAAQAVIAMENARLLTETREALEQQTATAEVLQVINSSPGDLAPVFDAILEKAVRLCDATYGQLATYDGEAFRFVAKHGVAPFVRRHPTGLRRPSDGVTWQRLVDGEPLVHIPDVADTDLYRDGHEAARAFVEIGGGRTLLTVAMRKDEVLLGALTVYRQEVRPFSDNQIALLQNFAAQAVIAMENARLLTETREALEQQTATAEVLGVINSSPGDLAPVFDAMLERATRLCDAPSGVLWTVEGEFSRAVALYGVPPAYAEYVREPLRMDPATGLYRVQHGQTFVATVDMADEELYRTGHPQRRAIVDLGRARSAVRVPLIKDGRPLGAFVIYRQEVRPFSDKQIALLQNFAAQAVIAMENARLITETRETLEQQTATAEVLQVINSSPGDLAPVFEAMLERATRLCEADAGVFCTYDGACFLPAAWRGFEEFPREAIRPHPETGIGRLALGEDLVHILDSTSGEAYESGDPGRRAIVRLGGARSQLCAALRKDGVLLGSFTIWRREVRPFSDKQIALLRNFAAQAVIAMENARLLGELRARTEEVAAWNRELEDRVAAQLGELERVGKLKRFLAPQLAELIVARGDEAVLETHRRDIVVVFCDLRDFTAFAETAEPEEVLELLREYHGALGPIVSASEGTLDHFSGDGIMVFFNDPLPVADASERAVRMAIEMREAMAGLQAQWRRQGRRIGFGAGIARGYATLGQIGFADRVDYTAIGTVCNLAARLCAEAKDGQILVSQRVAAAVGERMPLEEIGEVALKGLSQPVAVYNVPLARDQAALRLIEGGATNA
jgi:GAF domain-containing protein